MTFDELVKANNTIKTTPIKGKEYAEVNQRIKVFRMLYPNGTIETEILGTVDGVCIIKAVVKDEAGHILGMGHAYEKEGSSNINRTSYIENCETSAVGRALGMCGIGIDVSVASADEVENAIYQQAQAELVTKDMVDSLLAVAATKKKDGKNMTEKDVIDWLKVEKLSDLTVEKYRYAMNAMGAK